MENKILEAEKGSGLVDEEETGRVLLDAVANEWLLHEFAAVFLSPALPSRLFVRLIPRL